MSLSRVYNLPLFLNCSIIDFETAFDNSPTCIGWISGSEVHQVMRRRGAEDNFYENLKWGLWNMKKPMYAYVCSFENEIIGRLLGDSFAKARELQLIPYEPKREAVKFRHILDPFNGVGKYCMSEWEEYLKTGREAHLDKIMQHNLCCLFQELALLVLNPVLGVNKNEG